MLEGVEKRRRINGSSSGFMWGDLVISKYSSPCLRNIYLKAWGIYTGLSDPKYAVLGALNEERYEKEDVASYPDLKSAEREQEIKNPLSFNSSYLFSGRADFVTESYGNPNVVVHENKSADSTNTRLEVIRKGNYVPENLAQLVSYMDQKKTPYGVLSYDFYERGKSKKQEDVSKWYRREGRRFAVEINKNGIILVDQQASLFSIRDLWDHQKAQVRCIENDEIGPRPYNWEQKWGSPCTFCKFKPVCDRWDSEEIKTTKEFVEESNNVIKKQ